MRLRSQGDENFIVAGHDAPARQYPPPDMLNQHGVVMGPGIIGPGAEPLLAQRLPRAVTPFGHRKQRVVDLPIDEGIGVALPVQGLGDIFLGRWIFFRRLAQSISVAAPLDFAAGLRFGRTVSSPAFSAT